MTKRNPVSGQQNIYFDSEQLDENDLTAEQNYNNNFQTSLINNQIGSGVLPEVLNQNVLFDSLLVNGLLDGAAVSTQSQPSDKNLGNQLEFELTDSKVAGKKTVKVAIIGLDFQGNLQYDTFTFKQNEKKITKKHYTNILTILFNDFIGTTVQSFNLGGRLVIREANPFVISRDAIMVAQDIEPNLFWRDFFVTGAVTLQNLLTSALPLYNIDNLGIKTGFLQYTPLLKNDVTTQVGQKFLATTNNIEKITLLLGVQNTTSGQETNLAWHGDLIISIYPLQSTIECPTDVVPNLAIDFSPSNIPLAQISVNYNTLQASGVTLDGNAQPVDFVFSNTPVSNGSIIPGQYYAVTVKRSGSADQCDMLIATGSSISSQSRVTTFNGSVWVDLPDQSIWFRVWTDSVKVTDGQAYETGHGVIIPKVSIDPLTGTQVDYALSGVQFTGNSLYTAVVAATVEKSEIVQDQRTGNPILSRQQFVPTIQLLNPIDLSNLEAASEPFIIGVVTDKNQKSFDTSSATISSALHSWNFINNQFVIKVIDDTSDGYRYDPSVNALVSNLTNGDLNNAQIIPDVTHPNTFYRISKSEIVTMTYGDVNGDGIIDEKDLDLLNDLVGADLNVSPPASTQITTDGYNTTATNGYLTYAKPFVNSNSLNFQVVNPNTTAVMASGSDGMLVVNPNQPNLANFQSASVDFSTISGIGNYNLLISSSSTTSNIGIYPISGVDVAGPHVIDISKLYYNSDVMMQIMRADITGDFKVTTSDGYYLQEYLQKVAPFPTSTLPESRIGTKFTVIRLTVDPFTFKDSGNTLLERTDDFYATISNRATALHTTQDIFLNDGYFVAHDFKNHPAAFNIIKQFTWDAELVAVNSNPRFVPTIFTAESGLSIKNCTPGGIDYKVYPFVPSFDPGTIDSFIPNDLIIANGDIKNTDGTFYKIDLEVGTVTLEIPNNALGTELTINLFDYFVADYNATSRTRIGYPAMKFADCTTVQPNGLTLNQVRFSVSTQSFSPNLTGIDSDGYSGPIVDGKIGVFIDHSTGLLRLNFSDLYQDPVLQTLNTRIQINAYLKKGGFNNVPLTVDSATMANLLGLIS